MQDPDALVGWYTLFFVLSGLMVVALSVPLILRRVKPNAWYGFRTPKTWSDERIWYEANTYSGWLLLAAGIAWVASAVVLRWVPGIGSDLGSYALAQGIVVVVGLLVVLVLSFSHLRSL